ncbi:MAG: hypothetical protein K2K09_04055 [Lachnospiraceae bacterium]|nr:hypothetical protein [Lachnospiraceae bacterium]
MVRRVVAIFMVVMIIAVAIVMYMYWQRETTMIMKGVLVDSRNVVEKIL